MSYGGRTDDAGVGRETLIRRRKSDNGWLNGKIVEVKNEI